jgi:hypothetical protein
MAQRVRAPLHTLGTEWWFVVDPNGEGLKKAEVAEWPKEAPDRVAEPRQPKPLQDFISVMERDINPELDSKLEVIGVRLYTGPM